VVEERVVEERVVEERVVEERVVEERVVEEGTIEEGAMELTREERTGHDRVRGERARETVGADWAPWPLLSEGRNRSEQGDREERQEDRLHTRALLHARLGVRG